MDRGLYIAMSGAKQILHSQDSNSNNLANANTTGFRADLDQFRTMPMFGVGHPSRVYAMSERPGVNFSAAALQTTGRELDVAIDGEGWIAVRSKDGSEAYTRAGDLHITAQGQLVTGNGLQVMGNNGPIAIPPQEKIEIDRDGSINIVPQATPIANLAVIDRIKLVKPPLDQMEKGTDGLFRVKGGQPAPADAGVKLTTGTLEGSNVSTVGEMVQMIQLARQFEHQIKMMKTIDEDGGASAQIMRMG
ncbi:flagellar basal-body rod protein FlgF [Methylomagnum ishizawai]|uniref:Flagellar basal-body rod protein FlgF n=1 Tax=Methylomagnum ishizawai TaxID=1760988 RepID=A0A1Y6D023_9GAMM|nr:flagellar basal-body rod protein FlgF [Methylomagnum ishizawai]SMF95800.1 flagellar basal-body rod protein FlgF [Methylomagnum ishizawai]